LTTLSVLIRISIGEQKAKIETAMTTLPWKHGKLDTGLIGRGLEGFQNRVAVELQPSGVTELDAVLGGGFPRGSLVELCGPASSGRTSLTFSLLAQARNDRRPVRSSICRILSTPFLLGLREWNFRDCSGFDAEKQRTEDRISRRPLTLLLRTKKYEELAAQIPRAGSQCRYMVGGIRVN
jgi:recA bacterial DNA recombination protein